MRPAMPSCHPSPSAGPSVAAEMPEFAARGVRWMHCSAWTLPAFACKDGHPQSGVSCKPSAHIESRLSNSRAQVLFDSLGLDISAWCEVSLCISAYAPPLSLPLSTLRRHTAASLRRLCKSRPARQQRSRRADIHARAGLHAPCRTLHRRKSIELAGSRVHCTSPKSSGHRQQGNPEHHESSRREVGQLPVAPLLGLLSQHTYV
mmetsp:Transcript_67056/g.123566  ORF Transcript_67056/g.123566 Transcript_67056/m.123566 type:complete len:204 (-) Transcript_67056:47-658(-)